jgi:hypothetical protein
MVLADQFGVGTASRVLQEVSAALASWPDFSKAANVSASEVTRIAEHHQLLTH